MNPEIKEKVINLIFEYDVKKDYFWNKERIETQLKNWKKACDEWDKDALEYSKEDIIEHYQNLYYDRWIQNFLKITQQIIDKNKDVLDNLKYYNHVSLDIFEIVTWVKVKWLSNKKLEPIMNEYFK